ADAVREELVSLGMGEGELLVELHEREVGATGADAVAFLVRPNAGLPFAPVAETASGGELSRIALALAAVAGGETLVFDEIDAGIGGGTPPPRAPPPPPPPQPPPRPPRPHPP